MNEIGFPGGIVIVNLPAKCRRCKRRRFDPWDGKIPWSKEWEPMSVFLPGKFHGQRNLAGYSPQSHKESDIDLSD